MPASPCVLPEFASDCHASGLVSGAVDAQVQTRRRLLKVFFSDIVNFTRHTAILAPEVMSELLNQYFRTMTEIISEHGGTLDKFIGDALMRSKRSPWTLAGAPCAG